MSRVMACWCMVQNQEIALCRDKAGMPRVVRLEEKPADVIIDHAFSQADFSRKAIELLEKSANKIDPGQSQFLFVTDEDPAFVLIDLRERLIVFLSYPIDPDTQPSDLPGWFPLRALNTLVIRGFVISAIKNPCTLISRGLWHIGTSGAAALSAGSTGDSGPPPPLYTGPGMDLGAWEKQLDELVPARRYQGRVEFLIDGGQFFPALIKSVANAKRSVDMLVYIFGSRRIRGDHRRRAQGAFFRRCGCGCWWMKWGRSSGAGRCRRNRPSRRVSSVRATSNPTSRPVRGWRCGPAPTRG